MSERYANLKMVLTGTRRGQTILLNGHPFVRGVAYVAASPESFDAFLTLMGRSYQAHPEGSAALAAANERDRANGLLRDIQANPASPDGASAPVQSVGDHGAGAFPDPRTLLGAVDAGSEAGSSGMVSGGSGHADTGLGEGMESSSERESVAIMRGIQQAVQKLDPAVPEQWTEDGLPSVDYVAEAVRNQSVTREMIAAAAPGFNRIAAEDLAERF